MPSPDLAALFLDRDGVLNEDLPRSVRRLEDFRFLPGVLDALALLAKNGVPVVVVTNQAVVGRGEMTDATLDAIHERMLETIRSRGGEVLAIYACRHDASAGCDCRKPAPGLILRAAREHGFELGRVAVVGDDARDLEAAARAGAAPILVLTGKGRAIEPRVRSGELAARGVFPDLAAVARAALDGSLLSPSR